MFHSNVRSTGDLAGIFEFDGDTGYFYLCEIASNQGRKVAGAIRVLTTKPDFGQADVLVRWDSSESKVGLFIRDRLWAVFDAITGAKYGGNYHASFPPGIPAEMTNAF